ncbi:MAG: hypothetical protein IJQ02_07570 [Oscillospiraceae bacterium]|nr:hypothetical protein [Oscillospiraceae bacterium]
MKTQRIPFWDNVRFFLILLVVIGHFLDQVDSELFKGIFLFIYSFHMPLFLFVSGLFHRNVRIDEKVVSYFSIYVLLKLFFLILYRILGWSYTFSLLTERGVPWFMFALAVFTALTWLLRNAKPLPVLGINLLLACIAGYFSAIGDFLMLSRLLVFYPFYYLGTRIDRKKLEQLCDHRWLRVAGAVILLVWLALCIFDRSQLYFLRRFFVGRHSYSEARYALGPLYRLFSYGVSALFGFFVLAVVPRRNLGFLTLAGSRTLQVYFWHYYFLYVLIWFGVHTQICATFPGKLLWIVIAVALTLLLSLKPFGFLTDQVLRFPGKIKEMAKKRRTGA